MAKRKSKSGAKTHPLASAVKKFMTVAQKYDRPQKSDCIPIGLSIRFDGIKGPAVNCQVQKLYCCKCEEGEVCTDCSMGDGTKGKLVIKPLLDVKVPDAKTLLEPAVPTKPRKATRASKSAEKKRGGK